MKKEMGESESSLNPSAVVDGRPLWRPPLPSFQRPLKRTSSPCYGCKAFILRWNNLPTTTRDLIGWVSCALCLRVWGFLMLWDPGGTLIGVQPLLAGKWWRRDRSTCRLLWVMRWRRYQARLVFAFLHGGGWVLTWWLILFWWWGWLQITSGDGRWWSLGSLRWVPRVIWVLQMGWGWADATHMLGQTFPWVWIWDPGESLATSLLPWMMPLGVPSFFSGGSSPSRFYKKARYSHAVSTTIACFGEQCPLCWVESSFDWSADLLHARIANSDCWVYKSQGQDNGCVVGNYLEDNEDLPLEFASFYRKVSEQSFIVQGQLVDVVHLLVCSILALRPRRFWPLYAPNWDAPLSDFNR